MNLSSNGIAKQLDPDTLERLEQICTPVELAAGQLLEPMDADRQVYFPVGAVVSIWVEPSPQASRLALSLVGSEGMAGCAHLWPDTDAQWIGRVFKAGGAFQACAMQVQALLQQSPRLACAVSGFLWRQTLEIAQLSARMQLGEVRTRVALWLHLLQHKTGSLHLQLTHQSLADMTGIRRVSITLIMGELQDEGILQLHRGAIHIENLPELARAAGLGPRPHHRTAA